MFELQESGRQLLARDAPAAVMEDGVAQGMLLSRSSTEILLNVLRLYSDARLLFSNERFASAASLSVLAIEELAKFMSLTGFEPMAPRAWRVHTEKHRHSASFLLRKRYQLALREVLVETGVDNPTDTYTRLAAMEYGDGDMAVLDAVLDRLKADGSLRRFVHAHTKRLDQAKQVGFYVDLDDQLQVRSSPGDVTRETAEEHLAFLRAVIDAVRLALPEFGSGETIAAIEAAQE